jgi:anti-sigma B factor antagonist
MGDHFLNWVSIIAGPCPGRRPAAAGSIHFGSARRETMANEKTNLKIEKHAYKRADLIVIAGRVDSSNYTELDAVLQDSVANSRYNLVVNLAEVEYLSSAGLRSLVGGKRDCKEKGGDLCIAEPSERVQEVLNLAGLDSLFDIYDDNVAAIGSF